MSKQYGLSKIEFIIVLALIIMPFAGFYGYELKKTKDEVTMYADMEKNAVLGIFKKYVEMNSSNINSGKLDDGQLKYIKCANKICEVDLQVLLDFNLINPKWKKTLLSYPDVIMTGTIDLNKSPVGLDIKFSQEPNYYTYAVNVLNKRLLKTVNN